MSYTIPKTEKPFLLNSLIFSLELRHGCPNRDPSSQAVFWMNSSVTGDCASIPLLDCDMCSNIYSHYSWEPVTAS